MDFCKQNDCSSEGEESVEVYRNPSPPPELRGGHVGDEIGETAFSELWVVQTLMDFLEFVKGAVTEKTAEDDLMELDKKLEDKLCQLWDMSLDKDVVICLLKLPVVDAFVDALSCRRFPRLTEIIVGICGNMSCVDEGCDKLTNHTGFRVSLMSLCDSPDPPTLVELFRLLLTCLWNESFQSSWLKTFEEDDNFVSHLVFVMSSSTNVTLLKAVADFCDFVLDVSDETCVRWATSEFVRSLIEAVQQIGFDRDVKLVDTYVHILQLVSRFQGGREIVGNLSESVWSLVSKHLTSFDDFVDLDARPVGLASSLTLLAFLVTKSSDDSIVKTTWRIVDIVEKYDSVTNRTGRPNAEEDIVEDSLGELLQVLLSTHQRGLEFLGALDDFNEDVIARLWKFAARLSGHQTDSVASNYAGTLNNRIVTALQS